LQDCNAPDMIVRNYYVTRSNRHIQTALLLARAQLATE
jgi:hypothetical protein